ncbi:MAG: bifunctional heptose 7-phosphate kinase/heptose 1-phosphate adenyltransferase [Candidatus Omnitrophota bacterium]
MIKKKRIEDICSRFNTRRILVFGDVILDRYIFGNVERISPEAPVPVVKVKKEEYRAGGAGNVAINIDKLGACGILMGIAGDDMYAEQLDRLKAVNNAVLKLPFTRTLVKTRVIAQRQQIVRIDQEERIRVTPEVEIDIMGRIARLTGSDIHGIIVSDYAKGTLTHRVMECLKDKARTLNIPIIVDPKPANYHLYKHIDGITPNRAEAEAITKKIIETDTDAALAVKMIRNRFKTKFSIVTRGDKGISAGEQGKKVFHLPAFNHEVYDVTGAGDTVAAVLMLALISGANLREAAALSNVAASMVVEKIGASQVTPTEFVNRALSLFSK